MITFVLLFDLVKLHNEKKGHELQDLDIIRTWLPMTPGPLTCMTVPLLCA